MRTWPAILFMLILTIRTVNETHRDIRKSPSKNPLAIIFTNFLAIAIDIIILAYGGFWVVLGWAP